MGIPSMFRWISKKYPKIVSPVIEEQPQHVEGVKIPVDICGPNPNGEEFDNLYLDMNGIVHPCSHPEDKPPPQSEEEMMIEIFKYTERVFNMVRPRKILMIAVGKPLVSNIIVLLDNLLGSAICLLKIIRWGCSES
jgi:5'-3' exoribonuclease 2